MSPETNQKLIWLKDQRDRQTILRRELLLIQRHIDKVNDYRFTRLGNGLEVLFRERDRIKNEISEIETAIKEACGN